MTNNDKEERVINREQFDLIEEPWLEWASLPLAPTPQQHTDEEYETMFEHYRNCRERIVELERSLASETEKCVGSL